MFFRESSGRRRKAFTLVELLALVGIVGILLALLLPAAAKILPKADEIVCISHLHNLWLAFSPCATDPAGWPQLPKDVTPGTIQEQQWWLDYSSNNLGLSKSDWTCPTIARAALHASAQNQGPLISYLPTLFDSKVGTANRWPTMPWFSEIGNIHGQGNLVVRTDGAILPSVPQIPGN
jgi:Tfp pilus assembly protein FimT